MRQFGFAALVMLALGAVEAQAATLLGTRVSIGQMLGGRFVVADPSVTVQSPGTETTLNFGTRAIFEINIEANSITFASINASAFAVNFINDGVDNVLGTSLFFEDLNADTGAPIIAATFSANRGITNLTDRDLGFTASSVRVDLGDTLHAAGSGFSVNLTFGDAPSPAPIPLPAGLGLCAGGVLSLAVIAKRRHRRPS